MKILRCATICLLVLALVGCQQQATKDEGKPAEAEQPKIKPGDMALVPAGECIIGSNEPGEDGKPTTAFPERKLNLPAFYVDKYEVTNGEYRKFAATTGYVSEADKEGGATSWDQFATPERENYPVLNLTWEDANAYAKWAGKRLPKEEEWEKAGRGTDGRRYPWGNEWAGKANTYEAGIKQFRPVGSFPGDVSPYGVYDLVGNVQEWTDSWYKAYPGNKMKDPNFGEKWRVVRGGTPNHYGKRYHLWDRGAYNPKALYSIGFRCVKDAGKANLRLRPGERTVKRAQAWKSKAEWTWLALGRSLLPSNYLQHEAF